MATPCKQDHLPRLPVPPLNLTMERYLKSVEPFVTDEEMRKTRALAQEFLQTGGVGERLQKHIEKRAESTENWLEDWWLNVAYLEFRGSLVVNSSTGMAFEPRVFTSELQRLQLVASFVTSALDFKEILDSGKLPVERMGKYELDMTQHYRFFASCRVPQKGRDHQRFFGLGQFSQHFVVIHNYHVFAVPVLGADGARLNQAQVLSQLQQVVAASPERHPDPVGILTSLPRDEWAAARHILLTEATSRASLDKIETSLFVMCLDGAPSEHERRAESRTSAAAIKVMHGGGGSSNSPNRWVDKCLQGRRGNASPPDSSPTDMSPPDMSPPEMSALDTHIQNTVVGNRSLRLRRGR